MDLTHIERPVFLVDKRKALLNLARMTQKACASGVDLRPHVKTHQSADIAAWLKDFDIQKITVSSVDMAAYFSRSCWNDIMISVPVNIHQISRINTLAESMTLHVLVDSAFTASQLRKSITRSLHVWIEVDTGYHRTGVPIEWIEQIVDIAKIILDSCHLQLRGILCYQGQSYSAKTSADIKNVFITSLKTLKKAKNALSEAGLPDLLFSIGDTPSCSIAEAFPPPIDEIRPGNFIFYDLFQVSLGACRDEDIAAAVACPVISKHPERQEMLSMVAEYILAMNLSIFHPGSSALE